MASPIRGGTRATYAMFTREFARIMAGTKKGGGTERDVQRAKEALFSIERRLLVVLVNKHKAIIKSKFPTINMKDVVDSVEIKFRNAIDIEVRRLPKALSWDNKQKTVVAGRDLRALQNMSTEIRNRLRNEAIKAIAISTRNTTPEKEISNSIIIGGIDPRTTDNGGDATSEQLEVDIVKGVFKFKKGTGQDLARTAKKKGQGFDVGHTIGPGVDVLSGVIDNPQVTAFLTPGERLELIEIREEAHKIDVKMVVNTRLFNQSGRKQGEITITIAESSGVNQIEGGRLTTLKKRVRKLLNDVREDLITVYHGSPTIIDQYKRGIEDLFVKGKIKKSAFNKTKTYKASATGKIKKEVYGPSLRAVKGSPRRAPQPSSASSLPRILDILNDKLHDQIELNMGKGRSKKTLNYQTGRFAKSAIVQMLYPSTEKNAINAKVKYMKKPYDVFEPGGKLATGPGRNPALIFGKSIRQILIEERIAVLRRVKVDLIG